METFSLVSCFERLIWYANMVSAYHDKLQQFIPLYTFLSHIIFLYVPKVFQEKLT
jgi:hypothetical protein